MSAMEELKKLLQEAKNHKAEPIAEEPTAELQEEVLPEIVEEKVLNEKEVKALDELKALLGELQFAKTKLEETKDEIIEEVTPEEVSLVAKAAAYLNSSKKEKVTEAIKDPATPLNQNFVTFRELNDHYNLLINRIQQQMASIGGGGEVWLRNLNDVNRHTLTPSNDNWVMEWDAATKKAQFTHNIGPINSIKLDPTHVEDYEQVEGTICWSNPDRTMNIHHQNGVTQQVGQETYFVVKNATGSDIPNGTFVRFDGVTPDGPNRIDAAPFLADGTYPNLYGIGVTTEDIANGNIGFVTNFGMVRGLNTTGSDVSETWVVGQILYAHPTQAGKLTNVKPTAPDNVLPVCAVIAVSATEGEIFVRPTLEQRMDYGTISSSVNQPANATINTPKAITYNTTEVSNGITVDGTDTSKIVFEQSGLYTVTMNAQVLSTNASEKKVWMWIRKNGVDVPFSSRVISIVGNLEYKVLHVAHSISMDAGDYVQFMFASNAVAIRLQSEPATAFAPAAPSVRVQVEQNAL